MKCVHEIHRSQQAQRGNDQALEDEKALQPSDDERIRIHTSQFVARYTFNLKCYKVVGDLEGFFFPNNNRLDS
jgi:hypothetical protein